MWIPVARPVIRMTRSIALPLLQPAVRELRQMGLFMSYDRYGNRLNDDQLIWMTIVYCTRFD
jgi:hypothetical protein